jgi:hypothetical protein
MLSSWLHQSAAVEEAAPCRMALVGDNLDVSGPRAEGWLAGKP